jgi:hypothetical protein
MEVRITGHNFESWPPKDHSCHVCFKFTYWFQRRRLLNIFSIGSYVKTKLSGHLDFNQTCHNCSLDGPLPDLCFWCRSEIQHGCSDWLKPWKSSCQKKLPMKNERIWSYVKETTSHLQNKLTKNIHLGVATSTRPLFSWKFGDGMLSPWHNSISVHFS